MDALTAEPQPKTALAVGLADVRAVPLARLAREERSEGMARVLPGLNAKRIAAAQFQSSI
jgi:hypothetical protein